MLKSWMLIPLTLAAAAPAAAQQLVNVTTTGGFSAVAHREISTGSTTKAMVYSVLGALTMTPAGAGPVRLSAECLGFDEHGQGSPTVGIGRCLWKETAADAIYVSIRTEGDNNVYTVTGGTGKWHGAKGEIRTSFAYLPAPRGGLLAPRSGQRADQLGEKVNMLITAGLGAGFRFTVSLRPSSI